MLIACNLDRRKSAVHQIRITAAARGLGISRIDREFECGLIDAGILQQRGGQGHILPTVR